METSQSIGEQDFTASNPPNILNSTVNIYGMNPNIKHSTPAANIKRKSSATPPGGRERKQLVLQDYFQPETQSEPQPSFESNDTELSNYEQNP